MGSLRSSINLLTIPVVTIVLASVLVIAATVLTSRLIEHNSKRSADQANAALITAEMATTIHLLEGLLFEMAPGEPVNVESALDANDEAQKLFSQALDLTRLSEDSDADESLAFASDAQSAIRAFLVSPSIGDYARATDAIAGLDELIEPQEERLKAGALADQEEARSATVSARTIVIVTALASTIIVTLTSLFAGRRLRRALTETSMERDHLTEVTAAMQKRNDQFNALYQIVSEVTDNLSMRYVVDTTVREALKLVDADSVELRLLENDSLVRAGFIGMEESLNPAGETLPLGIGLSGRAAKRGKTIRLSAGAADAMAQDETFNAIESALIVPLIVGARVLGTLACWSKLREHFDADDERILELMASQVASAVAAAGLHATSENKALHDALTGLPNRRKLIEETPALQRRLDAGADMAFVMLDIDHFKRFNDDFGHRVGDVTLQKVAEVMRASLREGDQIYRYGGEEFVVILPTVQEADAVRLVDRLREAVSKTLLTGESLEPVGPVTVSAGIALAFIHGSDVTALLKVADEALYLSKENGRNRVTVAPSLRKEAA